jgi:homogentisate 1,2-dioxygenase
MNRDLIYQTGFGSYFETEAVAGSLPVGRNSPQQPAKGLYPELLSGTAFTMKRSENLRSWLYRIQPSVVQGQWVTYTQQTHWTSVVADDGQTPPQALRWMPLKEESSCDFIDGVKTMVANASSEGSAVHHYLFNQSMKEKYFYNADGELVFLPQEGTILLKTEMGILKVEPLEIAVIPRGVKFSVETTSSDWHRGYLGENTGAPLRLPELGPIGSNGLANVRDFKYPVAAFENSSQEVEMVCKFQNRFWKTNMNHSPLDVVAWHGNYAPYKYDLRQFNTIGTISYDHPDPSIFTVLTSPSATPGKANIDFVIFPPRWLVGENTFRPPYYHRNLMNEYMGLIQGVYDAKQGGFVPGGASLHNCMVPHGPDAETFYKELKREEKPQKVDSTMAFMFESSQVYQASSFALNEAPLDQKYWKCWQGLKNQFKAGQ